MSAASIAPWRASSTGSSRGVNADHAKRLARMLAFLDRASTPAELDIPGWRLHPLHGELAGFWSLTVSGNWRIIFRFSGADVEMLDYLDYH
ncbi:type II toxin-antitoxin system RelE/ParE family toxin [Janthinobacterium agaricidamnosum]|uniref:type II toxin-antitoxin system RelE/ParE family toxin n=1 Tax=Janthinobacterium agaricidamnosum TaxID=55508 RepID=UPI00068E0046|nr:type II toxin-antitoxin system RelE/ParE family toxin [Janthinobacterium agaricidamnosum]